MKISKREKLLICSLGIILLAFLYYKFGYTNLTKLVSEKAQQKQQVQQKYELAMTTIENMDNQKTNVKILNAKITNEATPFYPIISQEHIILEMDKLIKDSGLEGGMTFNQIEVKGVEEPKESVNGADLPESSMQSIADEYKSKYEASKQDKSVNENEDKNVDGNEDKNVNGKGDSKTGAETSASSKKDSSKSNKSDASNSKDSDVKKSKEQQTITQLKLTVDFNGSYENVVTFLKSLRTNTQKMPAYSINIKTKTLEEVKGSINMIIYALPKIDNTLGEYLTWTLNNTYGKDKPFTVNSEAGTGNKSEEETSDFMASVKTMDSDLPTVMIGKSNDLLRNTYVYADSNTEAQAEMVLTKDGDKYYYKYKTENASIPGNYNGNGNEFVPNGENIELKILSEGRIGTDDKSGLKLKIINNTDKLVNINVTGDDATDPRVSIDGDSKNINVIKK